MRALQTRQPILALALNEIAIKSMKTRRKEAKASRTRQSDRKNRGQRPITRVGDITTISGEWNCPIEARNGDVLQRPQDVLLVARRLFHTFAPGVANDG